MAWLLHKMETSRLNRQDLNWKAKGLKAHYYIVTRLDGLSSLYWDLCIDHIASIQRIEKYTIVQKIP